MEKEARPLTPITENELWKLGFIKDGFNGYELRIGQFTSDDRTLTLCGDYLYIRQRNDNIRMNDSLVSLWNKDLHSGFTVEQLQAIIFGITGQFNPTQP